MVYQWPQARVLRTLMVVIVLIVSADLGWSAYGQWAALGSSVEGSQVPTTVSGVLYSVLAVVMFFGGLAAVLLVPRSARYLIEVEQEMRKVVWPDRATVIRSTIVITIMTIMLSLFIVGVDFINQKVIQGLIYGVELDN